MHKLLCNRIIVAVCIVYLAIRFPTTRKQQKYALLFARTFGISLFHVHSKPFAI